jgi:23S rRNA pseudouridine2605 synthase
MKKELKSKAKTPAPKRAPKTARRDALDSAKAAAKSKPETASKSAGAKAKAPTVKAKTPATKTKAAKVKPAEKTAAKAEQPKADAKPKATAGAKSRKTKADNVPQIQLGEPVLDPIGDVISGEARTYLGDDESQGRVESPGQAEMDAYRAETESSATDGLLEDGPGMTAASGADADAGADEDDAEEEIPVKERPPVKLERLQKILSQAGIASRRHAEEMIVAGRVIVNGQVVTQLGSKADAGRDHIRVDGKLLKGAERHRYFVLNKPKGYVTTVSDPENRPTVMEFFSKTNERLYPVGRLDYLSEGLLLMTNDGELANLLTKAKSGVEKVYLVKVAGQPTEEELERLRGGIAIERGEAGSERVRTSPARIRQVRVGDNPWYEVVLTEGRNRELRKMFAAIGHFAEKIRRVGYGPLVLDVEPGKLRELTTEEVNALRLTAEGKIKPRRLRVDISLPKDAGRVSGKRGEKPWRDKPAGKRFDGPRGAAPERGEKPFVKREDRGPRTEGKPREFGGGREGGAERTGDRPRFDKRAGGPRAGSGFGARPSRPFGARPAFGGRPEGGGERKEWKPREFGGHSQGKPFRRDEKRGFGDRGSRPPRTNAGFDQRGGKPFGARPAFGGGSEDGAGQSRDRGADRGGDRPRFDNKEWKPRGQGFGAKPGERPAGRFDSAPRKPFRAQGAFVRPEGSFQRNDGPKKPFETGRGAGPGAGKSSDRRTGSKARWVPRPDGARPGGFKRPGKPGGFSIPGGSRPGGSSRPGGFSKPGGAGGGNRGGSRPGGGRPYGGQKRG